MSNKKTISIDLDGVIHDYKEGWKDGSIYGNEIDGAFNSIAKMIELGYSVFILSTRSPYQIKRWLDYLEDTQTPFYNLPFRYEVIPTWKFWLKFWNKKGVVGITNRKFPANVYIDDRALKFNGDWSETIVDLIGFKTYQGIS